MHFCGFCVSCYDEKFLHDVCYTCMHDYMVMHNAFFICFLYVMMNMPFYSIVIHLICHTFEVSGNICECNGFKSSNQLFSEQEFSKKERIVYLVAVIQLRDKQLGV